VSTAEQDLSHGSWQKANARQPRISHNGLFCGADWLVSRAVSVTNRTASPTYAALKRLLQVDKATGFSGHNSQHPAATTSAVRSRHWLFRPSQHHAAEAINWKDNV
jgi:hypothetical protein